MISSAIDIQSLHKTYSDGTQALKHIDLSVGTGDFFALLGANGAGKTTIIGILTGLVNKSGGQVQVFGHDIDKAFGAAKRSMGVVPQEMNFNMFEKIEQIVVNQAGYYGIDRHEAQIRTEELLKRLELFGKRHQPSRGLSGGMKRRLMIARALVHRPRLLILDEPTAGVDVELRHSMWDFLKQLNREGTTILLTTHYLEEVEQLCRNAAIIKNGEIILSGSVKNLRLMLDKDTYVIHVDAVKQIEHLADFNARKIDEHTLEADLGRDDTVNDFVSRMTSLGMMVTDFHPKANRMERLFLNILKDKTQ